MDRFLPTGADLSTLLREYPSSAGSDTKSTGRLAVMCAEAVPWRCHRSLIGDALQVRGFEVRHIMSAESTRLHVLTAFARVDGDRVSYPTL